MPLLLYNTSMATTFGGLILTSKHSFCFCLHPGNVSSRQLSNGTNADDLYICIATVGNTIQTVNSPMYDTYMSTPGNTAKIGTAHSNIQTAQSSQPVSGWERTYNALVSILPSQHSNSLCQPGIVGRCRSCNIYCNCRSWRIY